MPFYRGQGGAIFEMDDPNPKMVHQVELRAQQIAKGELVEIPADRIRRVETPELDRNGNSVGTVVQFVEADPEPADEAPKGRRGRRPDADPAPDFVDADGD